MEIKITQNKRNEVLGRSEIIAELMQKEVPSKIEVTKALTAQLNTKPELVIIKKIDSKYGQQKVIVDANVYDKEEEMNKIERKYMLKRNETKKEEGNEQAKEETKQEASEKVEEVKEEATEKKEEKKE